MSCSLFRRSTEGGLDLARITGCLLVLSLSLVSGCATIATLNSDDPETPQVYGGTRTHLDFIIFAIAAHFRSGSGGDALALYFVPLFAVDIPLSVVADTFLLPVTIERQRTAGARGQEIEDWKAAVEARDRPTIESFVDGNRKWLDTKVERGRTVLHYAVMDGDGSLVAWLLARDPNLEIRDWESKTPLHHAVNQGDTALVTTLLTKDQDLTIGDGRGRTALHLAAASGRLDIARLLLERGVPIDEQADWGDTPLGLAIAAEHDAMVEFLLREGADIDARKNVGRTLLHEASWKGDLALVERLLRWGADPNLRDDDSRWLFFFVTDGVTPLGDAAAGGHAEVVRALVRGGADMNAGYPDRDTPLDLARQNGQYDVVRLLQELGAKE